MLIRRTKKHITSSVALSGNARGGTDWIGEEVSLHRRVLLLLLLYKKCRQLVQEEQKVQAAERREPDDVVMSMWRHEQRGSKLACICRADAKLTFCTENLLFYAMFWSIFRVSGKKTDGPPPKVCANPPSSTMSNTPKSDHQEAREPQPQQSTTEEPSLVIISYHDLVAFSSTPTTTEHDAKNNLVKKVGQAFGPDCLGILAVTDVPGFVEKRQRLLPLARRLALLPDKTEIESPESLYQVGWSHGKEQLSDGKPDFAKGSFYANPCHDTSDNNTTTAHNSVSPEVAANNPGFFAPNVWPDRSLPELRDAFCDLGQLVVRVGILLARVCDVYAAQQCPSFPPHKLERSVSQFAKARLLHYFPISSDQQQQQQEEEEKGGADSSDWCGWHNDHVSKPVQCRCLVTLYCQSILLANISAFLYVYVLQGSLTGLVPAMYTDEESGCVVDCADSSSGGLFVQSRHRQQMHRVVLPLDSLGFQMGETSQIHSGGVLRATPHAVRSGSSRCSLSRQAFAVFMEPHYVGDMDLPPGKTVEDVNDVHTLPNGTLPTLCQRWKPGMTFGDFTDATLAAFYST